MSGGKANNKVKPSAKALLLFFAQEFQRSQGSSYPVAWAREGGQFKRLLSFYSEEELKQLVSFFFTGFSSSLVSRAGKTVGTFVYSVAEVAQAKRRDDEGKAKAKEGKSDFERLEKARAVLKEDFEKLEEARKRLGST